MNITLHMQPKTPPVTWNDFRQQYAPYSIAIDGFVRGAPEFDPHGPHLNINHHEDVKRLQTRASCAQALILVRQGLFEAFCDERGPCASVFANDCDEDVCTTWTILENPHLAQSTMNPILNRLVEIEEKLDTTAGAYPYPAYLPILRELAWIYSPYRMFRLSGGLMRRDEKEFHDVVINVEHRILRHIIGRGERIDLDIRYERIGGGKGWVMVKEIGAHARTGMYADGIRAFVSVRERGNGIFDCTLGRMSEFISYFDIPRIGKKLNAIEGCTDDAWGGGDTIYGTPRIRGTAILPSELETIIDEEIAI